MVRIKNLRPNNFAFRKILKIQKMFLLLFYNYKRKFSQMEQPLRVVIEDGPEAP